MRHIALCVFFSKCQTEKCADPVKVGGSARWKVSLRRRRCGCRNESRLPSVSSCCCTNTVYSTGLSVYTHAKRHRTRLHYRAALVWSNHNNTPIHASKMEKKNCWEISHHKTIKKIKNKRSQGLKTGLEWMCRGVAGCVTAGEKKQNKGLNSTFPG